MPPMQLIEHAIGCCIRVCDQEVRDARGLRVVGIQERAHDIEREIMRLCGPCRRRPPSVVSRCCGVHDCHNGLLAEMNRVRLKDEAEGERGGKGSGTSIDQATQTPQPLYALVTFKQMNLTPFLLTPFLPISPAPLDRLLRMGDGGRVGRKDRAHPVARPRATLPASAHAPSKQRRWPFWLALLATCGQPDPVAQNPLYGQVKATDPTTAQ